MSGISFEDRTGQLLTPREYQECIETVTRLMGPKLMTLSPELAVMVLQIRRCLIQGQKLTEQLERAVAELAAKSAQDGPPPAPRSGNCGNCGGVMWIPGTCPGCRTEYGSG